MIRSLTRLKAPNRLRMLLVVPAIAAAAAVLAACGSSGTSSASGSGSGSGSGSTGSPVATTGGSSLKTATIGGATVLTSSKGFTLYSFAPDTSTKSNCNGTCAQNWPPVKGPATASGVAGTFGTIKRSDGSVQATFDGHPLLHLRRRHRPRAGQGQRPERGRRAVARSRHLRYRPGRQLHIGLRRRRQRVLTGPHQVHAEDDR